MARFDAPVREKPGFTQKDNLAGGQAFTRPLKEELAALVVNSMVLDTYYESAGAQLERLADLVSHLARDGELKFAAQAAIYTRHQHGLRSISHALAGEVALMRFLSPKQSGDWGARFYDKVVFRLDDMLEIAGYWLHSRGKVPGDPTQTNLHLKKTLPSAMKRGFGRVFARQSEKMLAKWDGKATRSLTLRQLAHLVHPPGAEGSAVYKLRGGTLQSADTHEVKFTKIGQAMKGKTAEEAVEAKKAGWEELLKDGKLRYLACLRNCVRIIKEAPEATPTLIKKLTSAVDITGSKVLPFQIAVAAREVSKASGPEAGAVMLALSIALEQSLANVPKLAGATLVVVDESGSMSSRMTESGLTNLENASLFAAVLLKRNADCDLIRFAESAKYLTVLRADTVLTMARFIGDCRVPKMTNFNTPFQVARRAYDRIIILSDEQGWVGHLAPTGALADYERRNGAKPRIYMWNLSGTATCAFPADRVACLGGFSAKSLETIAALETDPQAMIHDIEAVEI